MGTMRASIFPAERPAWLLIPALLVSTALALSAARPSARTVASEPRVPDSVARGLEQIDATDAERHIRWLADPTREGRDTPSRGLDETARYVAQAFADAGLETLDSFLRTGEPESA